MKRLVPVVAAVALLASCGGDSNGSSGGSAAAAPTSLVGLLQRVPDSAVARDSEIYYFNFDRIRADAPDAADAVSDLINLSEASSMQANLPLRYSRCLPSEECIAELGFDTRSIDAFIEFGGPPDRTEVLVGEFSLAAVQAALETSPGGTDARVSAIDGATLVSVGAEGQTTIQDRSAYRPLGNSVTVGVGEPWLVSADRQAQVEQVFALETDQSLAADDAYAAVAAALDAAKVDYAVITPTIAGATWLLGGFGEVVTADDDGNTPDPTVVTYAFVFADEASAQAGAAAFRRIVETGESSSLGMAWSDALTVSSSSVDGAVLVVTMQATNPGWWNQPLLRQDNLLVF